MSDKKELGGASIRRLLNLDHDPPWTLPLVLAASLPPAAPQLTTPPTVTYDNKTMAIIMAVVVIVFFLSGLVSILTRQFGNRRTPIRARIDLDFPIRSPRSTSRTQGRGLDPEIIQSFPTFLYSAVKGRGALTCAVCLNDYEDDETLRFIPKCSHVFHPDCIDSWLATHHTCPACRANLLVPVQWETPVPSVGLEIRDSQEEDNESAKVDILLNRSGTMNENRGPSRSRSTGFLMAILFRRCRSMGQMRQRETMVGAGAGAREEWERFTLRLEEQNLSSRLKRTKSCVISTRMSSGRRGYRTRSVGSARGSNYFQLHNERFTSATILPNKCPTTSSNG